MNEAVTFIQNDDFHVAYRTIRRHEMRNHKIHLLFVEFLPLVCTAGCSETSVRSYQHTLRNIPQEHISYLFRGGSLISRTIFILIKA